MSDDVAPAAARGRLLETLLVYLKPRMAAMLVLGFASGLPLMMVFSKLSFWLRESGIDRTTIGFFYWVTLAYTVKFLWAPVLDRMPVPWLTKALGRRRSWMLVAIAGTVVGLLLISASDPALGLGLTLAGAFVLAYSGATLDISIDAWRIEAAPNEEQANMAATYVLGYRFAIMFSGLGLALAEFTNWHVSFAVMAGTMAVLGVLIVFMHEPPRDPRLAEETRLPFARRVAKAVIDPFQQVAGRLKAWILPVLGVVALYRLSDFTMGVMASPLYADLGFSKATVGLIQSGIGPWVIVAGGFIGGVAVVSAGLLRTLLVGAVITVITTGLFAWLAGRPEPVAWELFIIISADNFAAGFVGTAFIAYLSALTDRANAATQYALFSSLYAFFCKFIAGFSGALADAVGYQTFFLITAAYGIPAALLVMLLMARGTPEARGQREPAPAASAT